MRALMVVALMGCSEPASDDDEVDDTSPLVDTSTRDTAPPPFRWPLGLLGTYVFDLPPPMDAFAAEDLEGQGRGPMHLYNGTPTLLSVVGRQGDGQSEDAMDLLAEGRIELEAIGVSLVVLTRSSQPDNVTWAQAEGLTYLDVWADDDGEIELHYSALGTKPDVPGSMLFGPEGTLYLLYDRIQGAEDHIGDVVHDVGLLWPSP